MPHRVSVVIPARNEATHIDACVRSVMAQEIEGGLEVIVADGGSADATAEIARAAGARVVDNPRKHTPAGLNVALVAARGDVIIRFDAHAEMLPGYVAACVRALAEEPGAANVGGWREIRAGGPWARATGAALESRFGVGNPRLWRRPNKDQRRMDVDTVPLGCWPADVLRASGGWNEAYIRNQDFELNHRLRRRGGRVIFDPTICSIYHPRDSLRTLARQYWQYGRFKGKMLVADPESLRIRQLPPVALVAAMVAAPLHSRTGRIARAALGAYVLSVSVVTFRARAGWRTAPVLATMHLAWVAGLLRGLQAEIRRRPPR
jgi:succinoglycan biosynthesis protein ExoA